MGVFPFLQIQIEWVGKFRLNEVFQPLSRVAQLKTLIETPACSKRLLAETAQHHLLQSEAIKVKLKSHGSHSTEHQHKETKQATAKVISTGKLPAKTTDCHDAGSN